MYLNIKMLRRATFALRKLNSNKICRRFDHTHNQVLPKDPKDQDISKITKDLENITKKIEVMDYNINQGLHVINFTTQLNLTLIVGSLIGTLAIKML